jgi:hypothetical protein
MAVYASRNEQAIWISALTNRIAVNALQVDRASNRVSMHILCDRIADVYFNVPAGKRSTSFMPVYNPQDNSQWPELLGWLITIGEMTKVEE